MGSAQRGCSGRGHSQGAGSVQAGWERASERTQPSSTEGGWVPMGKSQTGFFFDRIELDGLQGHRQSPDQNEARGVLGVKLGDAA